MNQPRGSRSWVATRSRSVRRRANSTLGAPRNIATAASALTNRCRRRGVSSPTGTPLLVTMKLSPWSSPLMISPLSFRSCRWLISLATATSVARCATDGTSEDESDKRASRHRLPTRSLKRRACAALQAAEPTTTPSVCKRSRSGELADGTDNEGAPPNILGTRDHPLSEISVPLQG